MENALLNMKQEDGISELDIGTVSINLAHGNPESVCMVPPEMHVTNLTQAAALPPLVDMQNGGESVMMVEQSREEQVLHLQIQHATESENIAQAEEAAHVFYVYRDYFTCGACNKQMEDLMEFLQHKAQHTLGENVYKCELCKLVFLNKPSLLEHYTGVHGITVSDTTAEQQGNVQADNGQKQQPKVPSDLSNRVKSKRKTHGSSSRKQKLTASNTRIAEEKEIIHEETLVSNDVSEITPTDESHSEDNQTNPRFSKDKTEVVKDFNFVMLSETIKGAKITYTRTWFKCLHCEYRTRMKRCLIKHMSEYHHDMLSVHTSMVIKEDENVTNNHNHKVGEQHSRLMRLSTYDRLYPMTGKKKKRRIEKQDLPGVFTCTQCGKVFSRLRYLRKHSQTHHTTEKRFSCEECGKTFRFRNYLRVHQKSHANKLFKCNECDFESNINAAIHAHRQIHNQGSVLCDICGFAYTDRSTLTKHKRVHDMSRPYACNFPGCTWRFKTEIMCKAHIRAHTTEGKFKCWICGYVFRHKHHLQRHLKKMHTLDLSGKELDAHCNTHTIVRNNDPPAETLQLQCADCGLTFSSRQQLDKHLAKAHNIHLSIKELDEFCGATGTETSLLAHVDGDLGDGRLQVITAIAPEDFDRAGLMGNTGGQQVYIAIDSGSLEQFEVDQNAALEMNALYVQEEQEVPISSDEQHDDKAFFVSAL